MIHGAAHVIAAAPFPPCSLGFKGLTRQTLFAYCACIAPTPETPRRNPIPLLPATHTE
jgi:hypothetical protein